MTIIQNNALKLDAWANSSKNYQSYTQGQKVEDFSIFDYKSLGSTPEQRGSQYGENVEKFSQDYISQYDQDADGEMNFSEFVGMQQMAEKQAFGEAAPTKLTDEDYSLLQKGDMTSIKSFLNKVSTVFSTLVNYKSQFNELSQLDSENSTTVSAKEFGAYIGAADGQDDNGVDGNITYENMQTVPMQKGYSDALKTYYDDFYNS